MGKVTGFKEFNRETSKERPVEERIKDYKEIYIDMPEETLKEQGARCMDCGTPFCNWACPTGNICPDWNDLVYKNKWKEAYERLTLTGSFPEFTGRICPALCEGSCTLGANSNPVSIREIEKAIIERAFKEGWVKPNPPRVRTGKKIAVVGSGPAGLAAGKELNSVGHTVTVFERADEIGGLLRYGIPDFKLEKNIVRRRVALMEAEGIVFKTNTNIGVNYPSEKLKEEFDVVILTGGSTVPRDLQVEGRELQGVHFAMDYLSQQNKIVSGKTVEPKDVINAKDKVVVVIGGGDTGSDCIGTAIRQGAKEVYQYEIMPKPPVERDDTMPWPDFPRTLKTSSSHKEGCNREWCVSTKKLEGKDGKLTKLHGIKVKWEDNGTGRPQLVEVPDSNFEQEVDLVLLAMGFMYGDKNGPISDFGIEIDGRGNIKTDKNYKTNVEGVFAAGDIRRGQSLVVWAIHEGKQAAKAVDEYLMGETSLQG